MNVPDTMITCPNCNTEMMVKTPDEIVNQISPEVHSKIEPIGIIKVYKISSDEIKVFLNQKANFYVKGTKVELIPKYTEKKTKNGTRSFAALQLAFSEESHKKQHSYGFYSKIGENPDNAHFVDEIWNEMVKQYKFDRKEIESWLNSYKKLEELEEKFGITEKFLQDLRTYATPRRLPTNNKDVWIIFTARANAIISDMLTSAITHKLEGSLEIRSIKPINQTLIEFTVYLHPKETKVKEDPFIRKLIEENKK